VPVHPNSQYRRLTIELRKEMEMRKREFVLLLAVVGILSSGGI